MDGLGEVEFAVFDSVGGEAIDFCLGVGILTEDDGFGFGLDVDAPNGVLGCRCVRVVLATDEGWVNMEHSVFVCG